MTQAEVRIPLPEQAVRRRRPALVPVAAPRSGLAKPALVGTAVVLLALFALAAAHALLISGQVRLDDARRQLAADTEDVHRLRLRVAELEAPSRVLDVARDRLGMVEPVEVGYISALGADVGSPELVRVAAAQPAPTIAEFDGAASDAATASDRAADGADGADEGRDARADGDADGDGDAGADADGDPRRPSDDPDAPARAGDGAVG